MSLTDAIHNVWARQSELDQAEADGDPYEITRAQNALLEADIEYSAALGAALA